MSDDDDDEPEEDPRIMELLTYSNKHSDSEIIAFLREKGGEDALIYGILFPSRPLHAQAYFLLQGAVGLDCEQEVPPQLKEKKGLLKEFVGESEDTMAALLLVMELFFVKERSSEVSEDSEEFAQLLRVMWESKLLEQDVIEAWHGNENALQEFYPPFFSLDLAIAIRESTREFLFWLQEGEDEP
mmetsp:Transcript_17575/g.40869  ORF Transcript_17575/g.40869 Transcript_17575/m.40869 type:complete len:185 (-) Transcript_17575:93-647(-)